MTFSECVRRDFNLLVGVCLCQRCKKNNSTSCPWHCEPVWVKYNSNNRREIFDGVFSTVVHCLGTDCSSVCSSPSSISLSYSNLPAYTLGRRIWMSACRIHLARAWNAQKTQLNSFLCSRHGAIEHVAIIAVGMEGWENVFYDIKITTTTKMVYFSVTLTFWVWKLHIVVKVWLLLFFRW